MTELRGWQNSGHCLFPGKSSIASWQIFGVMNKKREVGWHEAADLKTSGDSITLAPLGKDKLRHDFVFHLSLLHPAAMASWKPAQGAGRWVQGEERGLFLKSSFSCRKPQPLLSGTSWGKAWGFLELMQPKRKGSENRWERAGPTLCSGVE